MTNFSEIKIMIVDDDRLFRRFLGSKIEKELNAQIIEAENPKKAFEIIKTGLPHLILLDMEMPIMDGFTALQLLRKIPSTSKIPVIACTALRNRDLVLNLLKLKISDYIEKSIPSDQMIRKIKKVIEAVYSK
jgi:CheY-like chemotaxis protein